MSILQSDYEITVIAAAIENGQRMLDWVLHEIDQQIAMSGDNGDVIKDLKELRIKLSGKKSRPESRRVAQELSPF